METRLRFAHGGDASAMYKISCQTHLSDVYRTLIPVSEYERFRSVYTENAEQHKTFLQRTHAKLNDASYKLWVAEADGVVAGYTIAKHDEYRWLLKSLFVLPDYQGYGIGRRLFRTSYETAPERLPIELTVIANNSRAVQMYEQEGFRYKASANKTFYGAPQVIMRRDN